MLLDHGLSWRQRGQPQPVNQAQDIGEQGSWDCDLRQLECDIAAVANNLGADLCRLFSQRSQLPVRRFFLPGLLPLRVNLRHSPVCFPRPELGVEQTCRGHGWIVCL